MPTNINDQSAQALIDKGKQLLFEINLAEKTKALKNLEAETLVPDFWQRSDCQAVMQRLTADKEQIEKFIELKKNIADLEASQALQAESQASQTESQASQADVSQLTDEFHSLIKKIKILIKELELSQYLNEKYDSCFAIFSIHAGQGGTEAMDWAEMLKRMYQKYFEKKGWTYQFISESRGEEAGIKEVQYEVKAPFAYGYLKREQGTHRLVRLSPFNADNLRQTSFALVEVLPVIEGEDDLDIKESDLTWHFTRSGGAGGQFVNKVNSAVELTYRPTGIVVRCREERSQAQNKERALKILKAKLVLRQEAEQKQALAQAKGQYRPASWGTQIRNYVLHPYKMVKDTRTRVESADPEAVLAGELDQFIEAEVKL